MSHAHTCSVVHSSMSRERFCPLSAVTRRLPLSSSSRSSNLAKTARVRVVLLLHFVGHLIPRSGCPCVPHVFHPLNLGVTLRQRLPQPIKPVGWSVRMADHGCHSGSEALALLPPDRTAPQRMTLTTLTTSSRRTRLPSGQTSLPPTHSLSRFISSLLSSSSSMSVEASSPSKCAAGGSQSVSL